MFYEALEYLAHEHREELRIAASAEKLASEARHARVTAGARPVGELCGATGLPLYSNETRTGQHQARPKREHARAGKRSRACTCMSNASQVTGA